MKQQPCDLLDDVIEGLADDVLHRLSVLFGHPLQPDAEGRLLRAAVVSEQQDVSQQLQIDKIRFNFFELKFVNLT